MLETTNQPPPVLDSNQGTGPRVAGDQHSPRRRVHPRGARGGGGGPGGPGGAVQDGAGPGRPVVLGENSWAEHWKTYGFFMDFPSFPMKHIGFMWI